MSETVALVVDGEFAARLYELRGAAVWVIGSATNRAVVDEIRRTDHDFPLTTFGGAGDLSFDLDYLLPTIELHHGPLSQDPPFNRLEVFGARPSQAAESALEDIGFELEGPTADGFTAKRTFPPIDYDDD